MRGKQDDQRRKGNKAGGASTGQGAASAMDALIKRRVAPPTQEIPQQAPAPKKH